MARAKSPATACTTRHRSVRRSARSRALNSKRQIVVEKPSHFQFSLRSALLGVAVLGVVLAFVTASWRNYMLRKATAVQLRSMGLYVAGDLYDVAIEGVRSDEE